jgi:hypothetical protein
LVAKPSKPIERSLSKDEERLVWNGPVKRRDSYPHEGVLLPVLRITREEMTKKTRILVLIFISKFIHSSIEH